MTAPRKRHDQRGAILPIMAVTIVLVIMIAAFGVDLGMQRVARRDMQAVADTVALDVGRLIDGRTRAQIEAGTGATPAKRSLAATLASSLTRNAHAAVGDTPTVHAYLVHVDTVTGKAPEDSSGTPIQVGSGEIPNAVVVTASTSVGFAFGGVTGVNAGSASRSATAWPGKPALCFSVGTRGLALNTSESALSPLLDKILGVDLGAIGYTGLVNAKNLAVPLAQLTANLGIATASQLATTSVKVSELALAAVNAIKAKSPTADVSALNSLLTLPVPGLSVPLGSILALTTGGPTAGLTGSVNALDLLTAALVVADPNAGAAVASTINVPGVTNLQVTITQPPQIACGTPDDVPQPLAKSAQISIKLHLGLGATAALGVADASGDVTIAVASGNATLTGLSCNPESATFNVDTGTATVTTTNPLSVKVTLAKFLGVIPGLGLVLKLALQALGLDPIGLDVNVGAALLSSHITGTVITYPPAPAMPPTYTLTGSSGNALTLNTASVALDSSAGGVLGLLGALLNPTLAAVTSGVVTPLVNTVISPVLSSLLNTLLPMLGITLGNTDVTVSGRPTCRSVQLVR